MLLAACGDDDTGSPQGEASAGAAGQQGGAGGSGGAAAGAAGKPAAGSGGGGLAGLGGASGGASGSSGQSGAGQGGASGGQGGASGQAQGGASGQAQGGASGQAQGGAGQAQGGAGQGAGGQGGGVPPAGEVSYSFTQPVSCTGGWCWENPRPTAQNIDAVRMFSETSGVALASGLVLAYDGSTWKQLGEIPSYNLRGLWGTSTSDVYAGNFECSSSSDPFVFHYDGSSWKPMTGVDCGSVTAIAGTASGHLFVTTTQALFHHDGKTWSKAAPQGVTQLNAVWAADESHAYAVGRNNEAFFFDGSGWKALAVPFTSSGVDAQLAVWGSSSSDVFIGGTEGLYRFDGVAWAKVSSENLQAIWGNGPGDVYALGTSGFSETRWYRWDGKALNPQPDLKYLPDWINTAHGVGSTWVGVGDAGSMLLVKEGKGTPITEGPSDTFRAAFVRSKTEAYGLQDVDLWVYDGTESKTYSTSGLDLFQATALWAADGQHVFVGSGQNVMRFDGALWHPTGFPGGGVAALWGFGPDEVFGVGAGGIIARWDGAAWTTQPSGTGEDLAAIWGSSPTNLYAGGEYAGLLHFDGKAWSPVPGMAEAKVLSITGSDAGHVFVGAMQGVFSRDGSGWVFAPMEGISAISALGDEVLCVLDLSPKNRLVRVKGESVTETFLPSHSNASLSFHALHAFSDEVWAFGDGGAFAKKKL